MSKWTYSKSATAYGSAHREAPYRMCQTQNYYTHERQHSFNAYACIYVCMQSYVTNV